MNRLLRQFKVVAHHKKISSACRELGISQPALSKSIKTLEDDFGLALFERLPRGMELTEAGRKLLIRINRIDMEYRYALEEMEELKKGKAIQLRVGAGPVWEKYLSKILIQLYDEYPGLSLVVRSDTNDHLLPDLVEGNLDVVLGGDGKTKSNPEQLVFVPLMEVKMRIIAHKSHPLAASSGQIKVSQLAEYPWVAYQRSKGVFLNHLFNRKGIKSVNYSLQTEFLTNALKMLEKRNALMCVAEQSYNELASEDIVKIELSEPVWNFLTGVWYQPAARQLPVVDRFIELMAEACSSD